MFKRAFSKGSTGGVVRNSKTSVGLREERGRGRGSSVVKVWNCYGRLFRTALGSDSRGCYKTNSIACENDWNADENNKSYAQEYKSRG